MVKGDCFTVAAHLVLLLDDRYVLCHGKPLGLGGDAKGLRYWHAWAEDGDDVIDRSNGLDIRMPKILYYALGSINEAEVRRYTHHAMVEALRHFEHYGPWPEGNDKP